MSWVISPNLPLSLSQYPPHPCAGMFFGGRLLPPCQPWLPDVRPYAVHLVSGARWAWADGGHIFAGTWMFNRSDLGFLAGQKHGAWRLDRLVDTDHR